MEFADLALTGLQATLLVAAVIGATEAVRRGFKKDWEAVVIIIVAGLLGGFGALFLAGFGAAIFFSGVAVGLGASGVVTLGQVLGNNRATFPTQR